MKFAEKSIINETSSLLFDMQKQFPSINAKSRSFNVQPDSTNSMQRRIRRSIATIRNGYSKRAARLLCQSDKVVHCCSEEQIEQLQSLHPKCNSKLPELPLASVDHYTIVDATTIIQVISRMTNGSSGGLSGWNADHLSVLVNDDSCMNGLAKLVSDIINDQINEQSRSLIIAGKLIGIPKNGDDTNLRPIAINEIFYRLAAAVVYFKTDSSIREILNESGIQYGLTMNGCQRVHSSVLSMLESKSIPKAALMIDFKNAFNSIDRAHVMNTIYTNRNLIAMHKFLQFAYGSVSPLYVLDESTGRHKHVIDSDNGVRQGDPLSSPLFALAVQYVYDRVLKYMETNYSNTSYSCHADCVKAIHDDLTIMVDMNVNAIREIMEIVTNSAAEIGMTVQPSKCKLVYLHELDAMESTELDAIESYCESIQLPCVDNTLFLGAPIAKTSEQFHSMNMDVVGKHRPFFDTIASNEMPVQESMMLLRLASHSRMEYLSQLVPTHDGLDAFKSFHDLTLGTALDKLQVYFVSPEHEFKDVHLQLSMSIADGGFGLTDISSTAPIAYYTTHLKCAYLDNSFWKLIHIDLSDYHNANEHRPIASYLNNAIRLIEENSVSESNHELLSPAYRLPKIRTANSLPINSKLKSFDEVAKTREKLMQILNKSNQLKWKQSTLQYLLTQREVDARLLCITAPHSSDWLYCVPTSKQLIIHDEAYRHSAHVRLAVEMNSVTKWTCSNSNDYCVCGWNLSTVGIHHYLSCLKTAGSRIHRHDYIKNAIKANCNTALLSCAVEPRKHIKNSKSNEFMRPDLVIFNTAGRHTMVDVTVSHPLRVGFVHKAALKQLASADDAAEKKLTKYANLTQQYNCNFVPFCCESFGSLNKSAVDLIDKLVFDSINKDTYRTAGQLRSDMFGSIAVAIAVGNYDMFMDWKNKMINKSANGKVIVVTHPSSKVKKIIRRKNDIESSSQSSLHPLSSSQETELLGNSEIAVDNPCSGPLPTVIDVVSDECKYDNVDDVQVDVDDDPLGTSNINNYHYYHKPDGNESDVQIVDHRVVPVPDGVVEEEVEVETQTEEADVQSVAGDSSEDAISVVELN
jgi:hypothetical protein